MTTAWAVGGLAVTVAAILFASRRAGGEPLFRWLPVPLWCYVLPAIAVALGWLPHEHPAYRILTEALLPIALGLLLLGVDLPSVLRTGGQALVAAVIGAMGVLGGVALSVWLLRPYLPLEAWKGAGALAGTWTGGTMNLLALRSILDTPDAIFAPLILVDAMIAYSWMAVLVAASSLQNPINQWLRVKDEMVISQAPVSSEPSSTVRPLLLICGLLAVSLAVGAHLLAARLPSTLLVSSTSGWTILLVTTGSLALSLISSIRRIGQHGGALGYPCLYLVLAATGAQASLSALREAPAWIVVGVGVVFVHGLALLLAGRLLRIPLGMLATASQANIGGVVSAPLVAAVYDQRLAPVGLLLAMAGNAVGTYLGWLAAMLCRWLLRM